MRSNKEKPKMDVKSNSNNTLSEDEYLILNELQQILGQKLPKLRQHELSKQGFTEHNQKITGLQLQKLNINKFPKIIENFSSLRTLRLSQNNLKQIDLRFVKKCPKVRNLDLKDNIISSLDLVPLQNSLELLNLILSENKIRSLDLSPLQYCKQLIVLNIKQNKLKEISLDFLDSSCSLSSLDLSNNSIRKLDITPLLNLKQFDNLLIDNKVLLFAEPVHRDYSVDFHWFTSEYLPHVAWHIPENDPPSQTLYPMYEKIIKNFRFEEFWADYRDRRMLVPSAQSYEVRFFESAVEWYLSIKNRVRTDSSRELRNNKRQAIESQYQDQFLGSPALITVLKEYFEFGYESEFTVQLFEGAIVIVRFWAYEGPSRSSLVQSFSWIKIVVDNTHQSYQVTKGFNRGLLRSGKKYHPIPPPVDFPSDLHTSTEVTYEIDTFTTASLPDLLNRSRSWLKNFFFPKFDPDNPDVLYGM